MKTDQQVPASSAEACCIARATEVLTSQSGQSLIEIAVLAPIVLSLLLGVIELGRYAYISILVANAARAGALQASRRSTISVEGYSSPLSKSIIRPSRP